MYRIIEVGGFSNPAPNKIDNEDSFLLPTYNVNNDIVFAIADGVGSSNGASKASKQAVNAISQKLNDKYFNLKECFYEAKMNVDELSIDNKSLSNSATTLTIAQVCNDVINVGHIGDCRLYYKSGNKLVQITKDHTRYQELLDSKEHSLNKIRKHKQRLSAVLTKAISHDAPTDPDYFSVPLSEITNENNEIVLIMMSDGTYHYWDKRPRFSEATMNSPSAFASSLRKRVQKQAHDDYTLVCVKLRS
ncbi:PP2C family protein-serine/threonine phosphatase [Photobacterium damselae]|uniref:PP2C family protein-serine/threonine phosphatase n=1 Tax=Photobacterium damselae TaxID=38293 RepID=UPI003D7D815F